MHAVCVLKLKKNFFLGQLLVTILTIFIAKILLKYYFSAFFGVFGLGFCVKPTFQAMQIFFTC